MPREERASIDEKAIEFTTTIDGGQGGKGGDIIIQADTGM